MSDRFWADTIGATAGQMWYVREQGKFLGSAKIERWRSHITVTLTELLPQSQLADWQTRTVDICPWKEISGAAILWELHLEPPMNSAPHQKHPPLELRFEEELLVLPARPGRVPPRGEAKMIFPGEGPGLTNYPWHGKIKVREELEELEKYGR